MSNSPYAPENAAAAAVLSSDLAVGDTGGDAASSAPPADPRPSAAQEEGPLSPVPPPPPEQQHGTTTTPTAPLTPTLPQAPPATVSPATSHAEPVNKYARGPAVLQRPHGPSLLTQALATARGIPLQNHAEPSHAKHPSSASHHYSVEPQEPPNRDPDGRDARHGALRQSDSDFLAPRLSPRKMAMPTSATMSTTVAPPFNGKLDLGEVNSLLNGHREFLSKAKSRASPLDVPERESRIRDWPGRSSTYPHEKTNGHAPASPRFTGSPTGLYDEPSNESSATDSRPRPRAWKSDHRISVVPEKAWSIGSGESSNGQDVPDGQVEKSITEVLAGVEPNTRSRKASHSLGFFKEGLPNEEKGKRKDRRAVQATRQKSPTRGEKLADIEEQPTSGEGVKAQGIEDNAFKAERQDQSRVTPTRTPDIRTTADGTDDYFQRKHREPDVWEDATKPVPPGHKPSDQEHQVLETVAPSTNTGLEAGDSAEDGDESGEEKISSAVFLPHQAPEQAEEQSPIPGVPQRAVPSRSHSRHDDFHPWLVKADEPEVDHERESIDYEEKIRLEAAETPSVAPEVAFSQPDEPAVADESEPGALSSLSSRPLSQYNEEVMHDHQLTPKQPLEAIELIPYKHQVGGHTTLWRFSRRAVCKQLNNRENEFYEKIEKYHRDLLPFLPRYIGVLNVTFQKQPRRKSTLKRDEAAALDRRQADANGRRTDTKTNGAALGDTTGESLETQQSDAAPRVVSQSLQSSSVQIPTVTFVDNQHILPRNLLQPTAGLPSFAGRFRSASASAQGVGACGVDGPSADSQDNGSRPSLQDRHANSWGATTVNKKLRNEVFNDAFLKQPIAIHRHRKGHQRPLPRRTIQQVLRPSGSDPSLIESHDKRSPVVGSTAAPHTEQNDSALTQSQRDRDATHGYVLNDETEPKDVTGTSAPEPEILGDSSPAQKKKRRYSGTGLRRKPKDVQDGRGDLQYFEEADDAGYKGDHEDVTPTQTLKAAHHRPEAPTREGTNGTSEGQHATAGPLGPSAGYSKIPRPVNPKEAQTQRDSRVEYFLLLEDLTAGMKRPCIMDLKMGTRQYGVDANPKKQKSQQRKCAETTSRELGVRLCGLQVWDVKTQSYIFKDKYYGRALKKGPELQEALTRFLYDGVDPSSILRHIPTVLQKLDELEVIIERLRGYRFYAASLLMFYDGGADSSSSSADRTTSNINAVEDSTTDFATDTEEAPRRTRRSRREIDFKMADFANCVTAGDLARDRPCPPKHPDEPDRGFLRGLRSLRRYFLKIQRDTRVQMGLVAPLREGAGGGALEREMEMEGDEEEGSVSE
ncbi:hypothetical protein VTK56DRAFT_7993 [Thermocarpiscus australiensis]